MPIPPPLTDLQLDNIQGDIWSKGFPKDYETYYFFSIEPSNAKLFATSLKELVSHSPPLVSTLRKVRDDRIRIGEDRDAAAAAAKREGASEKDARSQRIPVSNALIAFTRKGLDAIQKGLQDDDSLKLTRIGSTDPAFSKGMASEKIKKLLSDPDPNTWEPPFTSTAIHGMLKIAGSSQTEVEKHLKDIQTVLKHGTAIVDAFQKSPPTPADSRVDGQTRSDRGKEHFGFEDGISQPLMNGIDDLGSQPASEANANWGGMVTDPKLLIVTKDTYSEEGTVERPDWMYDGSFLVFRKLEQNVKAFELLTDQWQTKNCGSKEHMGAKLMGRWKSGAPIAKPEFATEDTKGPKTEKPSNDFEYKDEVCPVSAHIRKTNFREHVTSNDSDPRAIRTRIIRNGIAYGPDYKGHENDGSTRGLLFVCYQSHIEDGFQNIQANWSNSAKFRKGDPGHDPIIGQTANGKLKTNFTDKVNGKQTVEFDQLVTLKGGGYFFVPSIKALREDLSKV